MKKHLSTFLVMSFFATTVSAYTLSTKFATEDLNTSGTTNVGNHNYRTINVNGKLYANGISVNGNTVVSSKAKIKNSQLKAIKTGNDATIENSTILGNVNIAGDLDASNSSFSGSIINIEDDLNSKNNTYSVPVNISEDLTSKNDKFNLPISVSGELKADNSVFTGHISLAGSTTKLTQTTVNGNLINYANTRGTPTLILNNSNINGRVEFKQKGLIILKGSSKITGDVINSDVKQDN